MFQLRRLLEWKETLEKQAWAERIAFENRALQMRGDIQKLRELRANMPEPEHGDGAATIAELAQWSRYAEGLRAREASVQQRLAALRPEMASKVKAHLELQKEVKGLRKLQERERARHKKESEKKQQESIDDIASRRSFPGPGTTFRESTPAEERQRGSTLRESRRGRVSDPIRGKGT